MKKFFRFMGVCLIIATIVGGWCWWSNRTSNPWNAETIGDIPVPVGYTRVDAPSGSYAEYLRSLPLRKRWNQGKPLYLRRSKLPVSFYRSH